MLVRNPIFEVDNLCKLNHPGKVLPPNDGLIISCILRPLHSIVSSAVVIVDFGYKVEEVQQDGEGGRVCQKSAQLREWKVLSSSLRMHHTFGGAEHSCGNSKRVEILYCSKCTVADYWYMLF
jgi:hypothetical protein